MRKTVISAGVALILLSQPATAQVNPVVGAALAQANAALGQANAILDSPGISLGTGSPSAAPATPASAVVILPSAVPASLRPVQQGTERSTVYWSDPGGLTKTQASLQALRAPVRNRQGGAPAGIVQSCRNAVASSAIPYGAVGLDTAIAGPVRSTPAGYNVTIAARVLYSQPGGSEVRQATFTCQLNQAGQVIAMR